MTNFNKDFFSNNRKRLSKVLPKSLVIVAANSLVQQSADMAFPFRQDSNFWYLTGINEPDLVCVINTSIDDTTIFYNQQNAYQKEWDGEINVSLHQSISGITKFRDLSELSLVIKKAKNKGLQVCYLEPPAEIIEPYGFYANPARGRVAQIIKKIEEKPLDIRLDIARLRQIKQSIEIDSIKQAINITAESLSNTKNKLKTFRTEKEIERFITAEFYSNGADGHAYQPIIASGKNASIIHYNKNDQPIKENDLLLLDVGAKSEGYASDISRTWSIGRVSARQNQVFSLVLELQNIAISKLRPGVFVKEYQQQMEKIAFMEASKIGIEMEKYPHGFSHFLGLDVHDAGDYSSPLEPGSVLTVEPGIYLPKEKIGIRLEDNVLITKNGCENLSKHIPKLL